MESSVEAQVLEPGFSLEETYDFLTKNVPSLSDVELLIDDYTLSTPPCTIPVQYFTPEPWTPTGPPNRNCYSGPYDFRVEVNSGDVNKKKYLYSHRLHRIYVDMDTDFSLHFNWRAPLATGQVTGAGATLALHPHTMYVRATVVFSDDAQAEKRVERCTQHFYQNNAKLQVNDEMKVVLKNVLHSSRELGSAGVEYCGSVTADDAWFSVLVELTKINEQSVAHAYKFVCKNSCPNGINRRPIAILFTLEDREHKVYGRQMVGARVCSCPRRDMHKDEKTEGVQGGGCEAGGGSGGRKKRAKVPATPTSTASVERLAKKIKVEANGVTSTISTDEVGLDVVVLPSLEVIGSRAAVTGLEVMRNMMQQTLDQTSTMDGGHPAAESYNTCIARLNALIDDIKAKGNL